jgi:hypothetical protein
LLQKDWINQSEEWIQDLAWAIACFAFDFIFQLVFRPLYSLSVF